MNRHTIKFRAADKDIFEAIRTGKKKIETRAGTVKNAKIQKGDLLFFSCGKEKFERKVKGVESFASIDDLLQKYKPKQINPKLKTVEETYTMYYSFPGYKDKIKEFGIIAFALDKK